MVYLLTSFLLASVCFCRIIRPRMSCDSNFCFSGHTRTLTMPVSQARIPPGTRGLRPLVLGYSSNTRSLSSMHGLRPASGSRPCLSARPGYSLHYYRICFCMQFSRYIRKLKTRHPPALPYRLQHSTIGRMGLNHRVRDGNGCFPHAHRHRILIPEQ